MCDKGNLEAGQGIFLDFRGFLKKFMGIRFFEKGGSDFLKKRRISLRLKSDCVEM